MQFIFNVITLVNYEKDRTNLLCGMIVGKLDSRFIEMDEEDYRPAVKIFLIKKKRSCNPDTNLT